MLSFRHFTFGTTAKINICKTPPNITRMALKGMHNVSIPLLSLHFFQNSLWLSLFFSSMLCSTPVVCNNMWCSIVCLCSFGFVTKSIWFVVVVALSIGMEGRPRMVRETYPYDVHHKGIFYMVQQAGSEPLTKKACAIATAQSVP